MAEDKPEEAKRISPEELKELKTAFSHIRISQINMQQANLAYQTLTLKIAERYNVQDEQYDIDRLTGVIRIKPGVLPGMGGGPQQAG